MFLVIACGGSLANAADPDKHAASAAHRTQHTLTPGSEDLCIAAAFEPRRRVLRGVGFLRTKFEHPVRSDPGWPGDRDLNAVSDGVYLAPSYN